MGFFSSREKTFVGTSVSRAIEDRMLPNSIKTGLVRAIASDGEKVPHILDELAVSIGLRSERFYRYAESGGYPLGLPSGDLFAPYEGFEEVSAILRGLYGNDIVVDYVRYGPANIAHFCNKVFLDQYNYNTHTGVVGTLSAQRGKTFWLEQMNISLNQALFNNYDPFVYSMLGTSLRAISNVRFSEKTLSNNLSFFGQTGLAVIANRLDRVERTYPAYKVSPDFEGGLYLCTATGPNYSPESEMITVPMPAYNPEADYYHAGFFIGEQLHFFTYEAGTGVYPQLDALQYTRPKVHIGDFYPNIYYRHNKQKVSDFAGESIVAGSKKAAKYLKIGFSSTEDAVHENPDIDDVETAYNWFALPIRPTAPIETEYLFKFFDRLAQAGGGVTDRNILKSQGWFNGTLEPHSNSMEIRDAWSRTTFGYHSITRRVLKGQIAPRGGYGFYTKYSEREYTDAEDVFGVFGSLGHQRQITVFCFQHQVAQHLYVELEVSDPRTTYYVYGNHAVLGDGDDPFFLVPLDRQVVETFSLPEKEQLLSRALYYVFHSRVVQKVKWYQDSFFSGLLFIISVAIAVIGLAPVISGAMALFEAGFITAMQAVWMVAKTVLGGILLNQAFTLFVKQVGADFALIAAGVAAVIGLGNMALSKGLPNIPFADDMLSIANGLVKSIGESYTKAIQGIQEEMVALKDEYTELSKLIEQTQDLLTVDSYLTPYMLIGESASDYYGRTMHSGNIGKYAIKSVSTYVKRAVSLPTISDTLGGNFNHVV